MTRRTIGVVMNGVTGRMGYRQHLVRSILALREQGGLPLADGTLIWPEPVLVGRNAEKLKSIAERHSLASWTTELDSALGDPGNEIYFDAQLTHLRYPAVKRALAAGKHVYLEKPVAATLPEALDLARLADQAGLRHGVVHDKIFLPGLDRAGPRIYAFQVCDFLVPIPADALLGRGHVDDGVIDIPMLARAVIGAGYRGLVEVEIFNQEVWDTPGQQTLRTVIDRYRRHLSAVTDAGRPAPC